MQLKYCNCVNFQMISKN